MRQREFLLFLRLPKISSIGLNPRALGYPPSPYIGYLRNFVEQKYEIEVVVGTHPIPQKYHLTHQALGTWNSPEWKEKIKHVLTDEQTRLKYN